MIHAAIASKDLEIFKYVLERVSKESLQKKEFIYVFEDGALMKANVIAAAVFMNQPEILKILLSEVNELKDERTKVACTKNHLIEFNEGYFRKIEYTPIQIAVEKESDKDKQNHKCVKILLDAGVDGNVTNKDDGFTLLHTAVYIRDVDKVKMLVDIFGADVTALNKRQETAADFLRDNKPFIDAKQKIPNDTYHKSIKI